MTQAKRMEHAVGDLLDAGRLTRGESVLQLRSTDIDTLVRRVVRDFPFADERRLDLSVQSATARVDPARVERLLDDLLTAAVARTERGARIALNVETTADGVLISVEDGRREDAVVGPASAFLAELHGGWAQDGGLRLGDGRRRLSGPVVIRTIRSSSLHDDRAASPPAHLLHEDRRRELVLHLF